MTGDKESNGAGIQVLHVNTSAIGGAARAAYRIHQSAQQAGVDSKFLTERGPLASGSGSLTYRASTGAGRRLLRRARRWRVERESKNYARSIPAGYEKFRGDRSPYGKSFASDLPSCDLVHLHWVSGFLDFSALPLMATRAPIVWTLHDMNAFTGGCHYAGSCRGFRDACGRCPQLGSDDCDDLSRRVLRRKVAALRAVRPDRLHLVSPSRWLARQAESSAVFGGRSCQVIPYGVDTGVFRPQDRRAARAALGIGEKEKVVLFVAESVGVRRKGVNVLIDALGRLQQSDLRLLTVGQGSCEVPVNIKATQLGAIHDDERMSLAYSAADVFACPSLEDNLPNTVLEAMSCGVPVAAFDVGGIPEMVSQGETGFLAAPGDVRGFAKAIDLVLLNGDPGRLAAACRQRAEREHSLGTQGERYLRLYERLAK